MYSCERIRNDYDNARTNYRKEDMFRAGGRTPTTVGQDINTGVDTMNLTTYRHEYDSFNIDYGTNTIGENIGQRPNIRLKDPLHQIVESRFDENIKNDLIQ